MARKKIFIDLDTQVDYCLKGFNRHNSYVDGVTKEVLNNMELIANHAVRNKIQIIGSVTSNDYESKFCVKGTSGWLKSHETYIKKSLYIQQHELLSLGTHEQKLKNAQAIWFEKEGTGSLFSNGNISEFLSLFGLRDKTDFYVFGIKPTTTILDLKQELIATDTTISFIPNASCKLSDEEIKIINGCCLIKTIKESTDNEQ